MNVETRRLRVEDVPAERMPEVLRVAAELHAQEQSRIAQVEEHQQLMEAAKEVGLPPDIIERAAAIVAEREARKEAASRGRSESRKPKVVLMALGLVVGLVVAKRTGAFDSGPAPPAPAAVAARATAAPVAPLLGPCTEVDLSRHVTHRLDESMQSEGNHLRTLLAGLREGGVSHRILNGVPFRLDGVVLVGPGEITRGEPAVTPPAAQVEGIAIDQKVKRLHFLHGTHWRAEDGTKIGAYIVHYANGSRLEIPIRYGEDVRDWWMTSDRNSEVTRAQVAWSGSNDRSAGLRSGIRLFMRSWDNPYPEQKIVSLDMVTGEQAAGKEAPSPFLVGLTAEQETPSVARVKPPAKPAPE